MKRRSVIGVTTVGVALLLGAGFQAAQPHATQPTDPAMDMPRLFRPGEIKWNKGPESLPAGAEIAVLEGDPSKAGPFVFRAKLPDGYTIPPHTHPKTERVTVISGTLHLAMGERLDKSAGNVMPAGTFGFWPAGMKHFAWVSGETIIQLHGTGPWEINYLNPADDPRNAGNKR